MTSNTYNQPYQIRIHYFSMTLKSQVSSQKVGIVNGTDPQNFGQDQEKIYSCATHFLKQVQSFTNLCLLISRIDVRMRVLVSRTAAFFELAWPICSQWYTRVLQVTTESFSLDFRGFGIAYRNAHSSLFTPHLHILPSIQRHKLSFSCACNWNIAFFTLILAYLPFHFGVPV